MQKLKHTKKPFWRNKKDVQDRALGLLMVVVGVLSLSFSLPAFGGGGISSNVAGVSALEVCRQEFDACGADGSCAPVAMEDGKLIPRACSAGECRSTPELKDKYAEVASKCKNILASRHEVMQTAARWEEYSKAAAESFFPSTEAGWSAGDIMDSIFETKESAYAGAVIDTAMDADNYRKHATNAWYVAQKAYYGARAAGLSAGAAAGGVTTAVSAAAAPVFLTSTGISLTKVTLAEFAEIGQEVAGIYNASVQELDAQWTGCLNEAKSIKATEQQLLGF